MSKTAAEWIEHFNSVIKDAENYCILARDRSLQKEAAERLTFMMEDCAAIKAQAVTAKDENAANLMLGFECVADCLKNELAMYIALKESEPDRAWDNLIAAQMAAAAAARAHDGFSHLHHQAQRLEEIEKLAFPPQVFVSAGLIVKRQECSICGGEYGECDHVAGRPYWGEFCAIVARDIEANHVAIVKDPADKRCRVMQFSTEAGERNRMSWKVEPPKIARAASGVDDEGEGLRATASILRSAS